MQVFNAFVLPKKVNTLREVRVSDIKAAFPFNVSQYHFRFQTKMGNMKVWIDTSRDTVAVPNIDGIIKIKLLELPHGVRPKQPLAAPEVKQPAKDPNFEKSRSSTNQAEEFKPSNGKPIHHSSSYNNVSDAQKDKIMSNGHKNHSQQDHDEDLIGGFDDDENHHSQEDQYKDLDFDLDTDDILGGNDTGHTHPPSNQYSNEENLLGDFETNNNIGSKKEPDNTFDLAGGLGDLGGLDFSASNAPSKEETKSAPSKPQSLIDHVTEMHETGEKEKEAWAEAYKKHDHRIQMWKGVPHQHSVKILL